MSRRQWLMQAFLWVSVLAWGIGVGAKLYDLRVVAGAWSAAPPESLRLLPYGPHFPVDPGSTCCSSLCSPKRHKAPRRPGLPLPP